MRPREARFETREISRLEKLFEKREISRKSSEVNFFQGSRNKTRIFFRENCLFPGKNKRSAELSRTGPPRDGRACLRTSDAHADAPSHSLSGPFFCRVWIRHDLSDTKSRFGSSFWEQSDTKSKSNPNQIPDFKSVLTVFNGFS